MEILSIERAMDVTAGIFTAPRPGIYFFSFTGISHQHNTVYVGLYVNNRQMGSGLGSSNSYSQTFTLQSVLHLNAEDKVSVQIYDGGSLYDANNHYTHFIGWFLQEDISN